MLTEVICGVLGRHNMVARNINISIQNCKTENYSQASLCCRPKLVSDLVQASNGYNFERDSKDARTSEFFSSSFLFFFLVRLFILFFAPLCLFSFIIIFNLKVHQHITRKMIGCSHNYQKSICSLSFVCLFLFPRS